MQIKLSTKSFDPQSAAVLARGIANVRGSLLDADLSDIIAGEWSTLRPISSASSVGPLQSAASSAANGTHTASKCHILLP